MRQYLDVLRHVREHGEARPTRQGGKVLSSFGLQMRFNLEDGFPAVTTKALAFEMVKAELLWFLSGSRDVNDLRRYGCKIWDGDAERADWKARAEFDGDVGRIYGVQWRSWQRPDGSKLDQIEELVKNLRASPYDRRHVVSAWNPGELDQMALPPCHVLFQLFVSQGKLSMQMYQRSCDLFLGVPFNIASYSLLLHMLAQVTGYGVGHFIHTLGDCHIYEEHLDSVAQQLEREPLPLPQLELNPAVDAIDGFKMDDIALVGYRSHGKIRARLVV
jgi:thymidylate synthase